MTFENLESIGNTSTDLLISSPDLVSSVSDDGPRNENLGVVKRWVANCRATNVRNALLKEILVVRGETQLRFRYTHCEPTGTYVWSPPPRHQDAMFIQHRNGSQRAYALRVEGIAIAPNDTWVKGGGYLDYVVYFPPIDESWGPIAISEGNAMFSKSKDRYWYWKRVALVSQ